MLTDLGIVNIRGFLSGTKHDVVRMMHFTLFLLPTLSTSKLSSLGSTCILFPKTVPPFGVGKAGESVCA